MTTELALLVGSVILGIVHIIIVSHLQSWQRGYRWAASSRERSVAPLTGIAGRAVYRELRSICAMCSDYDPKSPHWHEFYAHTQAKFMWAVTTHTPAEMIMSRANADHENMGLRTWKGERVTQADADVAKNYLVEGEIRELNRLTTILLDIFEDQLDLGRISTMTEIETLLNSQLQSLGRNVLRGGGSVKTTEAKAYALEQYKQFNEKRRAIRHAQADAALSQLVQQEKILPKPKRSKND